VSRRLIFLGSGTSHGVPVIACRCPVCRSSDPCNKRTRCAVVLQSGRGTVLVDAPPELRLQMVRAGIERLDAVLLTHTHADHVFGLDDLRRFNQIHEKPLPTYARLEDLAIIRRVFGYMFDDYARRIPSGGIPSLDLREVPDRFELCGETVRPIPLRHGGFGVLGYRFGDMAYCTDCNEIPASSRPLLKGLDVLVLDALRRRPHPTHFSLDESLAVVADLKPRRAYLTHISHDLDHQSTNRELPQGVELAYDGLIVDL